MKLGIALAAVGVVLRFTTPGPGSYYVYTVVTERAMIVASGYVTNACHVVFTLPRGAGIELYRASFFPSERGQL